VSISIAGWLRASDAGIAQHLWDIHRRAHVDRLFAHYCRRAEPAGAER